MSDALIRVMVGADVAPILKVAEASSTASTSIEKMGVAFATAGGQSAQLDRIIQILDTRLQAVGASGKKAAEGISATGSATAAARVEMGALDGSTGMMLGGLARMAGQSSALAPLIKAAFPVIGALGFLEVGSQVIGAADKLFDRFVSLKTEEDEVTAATVKLSEATYQYGQAAMHVRESTLGVLAGPLAEAKAKLTDLSSTVYPIKIDDKEIKDLPEYTRKFIDELKSAPGQIGVPAEQMSATISRIGDEIKKQQKIATDARAEIDKMGSAEMEGGGFVGLGLDKTAHEAEISAGLLKAVFADLTAAHEEYSARRAEAQAGVFKAQEQENEKSLQSGLASDKEKYSAGEQTSLKSIERDRSAAQAKLAAGQISADEEISQLLALDARKADIERAADARAASSKKAEAEIRANKEEIESLDRMARADLEASEKKAHAAESLTLAKLRGIEMVATAQAKADDEAIKRLLEAKQITPNQAASGFVADATKRHDTDVSAKRGEIDAAKDDPAKLETLQAELKTLEINFQTEIASYKAEGAKKTEEMQMQSIDRLVSATAEGANRQLEAEMRMDEDRLRHREATLNQTVSAEQSALDKWLAVNMEKLNIALDFAEANGGKEGDAYQRLIQKKEQLDQQYAQKSAAIQQQVADHYAQGFAKINSSAVGTFNSILTGQKTVGGAFAALGGQLVEGLADDLLQMGMKWAEHYLLVNLLGKSSKAQELLELVTGASAKKAVETTANVASVSGSAGVAGAAGFASVMEALPFPVNVATAPEVAGAAVASTLAIGLPAASAARGMIVPADGTLAVLHQKEMVLPAHLSTGVQSMIDGGGSRGGFGKGGGDLHIHNENNTKIDALDGKGMDRVYSHMRDRIRSDIFDAIKNLQ